MSNGIAYYIKQIDHNVVDNYFDYPNFICRDSLFKQKSPKSILLKRIVMRHASLFHLK